MPTANASTRRTLLVTGPGELRLDVRPSPVPGAGDVVLRVEACGICGSDLGYVAAGGLPARAGNPLALGHEFVGRVESVGEGVQGLAPGMRVVVNPDDNVIGNGGPEGAFAERVVVRAARSGDNVLPLPDRLLPEIGALVEPLAVGLHGVNRGAVGPGSKAVVLGAGMIGLSTVIGLRHRGVEDIVVVDRIESRLALARRFGATITINPERDDLQATLAAAHGTTSRYGWSLVNTDAYFDTAGAPALLDQVLNLCRNGARVVVLALHRAPYALNLVGLMGKEVELVGSCAYPQEEFREVLDMLAAGEVDPAPLITHRFRFDQVLDAFAQARDPEAALKVMVEFE